MAIVGAMFALFGHLLPTFSTSTSALGQLVRTQLTSTYPSSIEHPEQSYQVQIFSRDPLVVYIRNFLSADEISYLLDIR